MKSLLSRVSFLWVPAALGVAMLGCSSEAQEPVVQEHAALTDAEAIQRCNESGLNVIIGTPNNDTLTGTAAGDCIAALGGQDTVNALGGNDLVFGGAGNDVINGGDGNDGVDG